MATCTATTVPDGEGIGLGEDVLGAHEVGLEGGGVEVVQHGAVGRTERGAVGLGVGRGVGDVDVAEAAGGRGLEGDALSSERGGRGPARGGGHGEQAEHRHEEGG